MRPQIPEHQHWRYVEISDGFGKKLKNIEMELWIELTSCSIKSAHIYFFLLERGGIFSL